MEERSFFVTKTIDQLIAEQGIHPITDLTLLAGAIPDEDVDAFVAEIYSARDRFTTWGCAVAPPIHHF